MGKVYKINGNEYEVSVNSLVGKHAEVKVNGVIYKVEISDNPSTADKPLDTCVNVSPCLPKSQGVNPKGDKKIIKAPLPGVILDIRVRIGELVKVGQTIAVLEAMKMENDIQSEYEGVILSVDVNPGDSILEGSSIVTIG